MKITTAKQPLRTPCMTPMPSLWRGRQCDLTPTWTQFAQWYNTATRCLLQNPGNRHTEQCTFSSLLNKAHFSGLAGSPFPEEWQRRVFFFFFHKLDQNSSSCVPWRVLQRSGCTLGVLAHSLFAFFKKEIILKHKLICIYWRSIHYQYFCAL